MGVSKGRIKCSYRKDSGSFGKKRVEAHHGVGLNESTLHVIKYVRRVVAPGLGM
jgi:hypothetical protein